MILAIILVIFNIISIGALVWLIILAIKALLKYLKSSDVRNEQKSTRQSLAEVLKNHRVECKMTQEFVSEAVGVSRGAVSKQGEFFEFKGKWHIRSKHIESYCTCKAIWNFSRRVNKRNRIK